MKIKLFFRNSWGKITSKTMDFDNQPQYFNFIVEYNKINTKGRIFRFLEQIGDRLSFETTETPNNLLSPQKIESAIVNYRDINGNYKTTKIPFLSVLLINRATLLTLCKYLPKFDELISVERDFVI